MKHILITFLSSLLLICSVVNAQTITNYTDADGLPSSSVTAIAVADNDDVWFGTIVGVCVYDGNTWTTHTTSTDPGLVDDGITAVGCMSNGDVWVGSNFGVSVYAGTSWTTYTENDGLGENKINSISEGANGEVWFGTNDGISIFDGTNWTNWGTTEGLPFGGVKHVTFAANGDAWLSSGLGGAIKYDGNSFSIITEADGLLDDKVRAIAIDAQNRKWIATAKGVSVFGGNDQHETQHTIMLTLPAPDTLNPVEDIIIDHQGNVWAGIFVDYLLTEGGVAMYNGFGWTDWDVSDGLVGPVAHGLAIDSNGDIWIATVTGVSRLSGSPTAVTESIAKDEFVLYPNPSTETLNVQREYAEGLPRATVAVYDTRMQLVAEEQFAAGQSLISLPVEQWEGGLYFVQVGNTLHKVVVQ